jgi:predicted ABC-type ATPase
MTRLLLEAADNGGEVCMLYAGLASAELHIERVRARVAGGGHHIPEARIRKRWEWSRRNLITLMPKLALLRVFDNSADGDPATGKTPQPILILEMRDGKITGPPDLSETPSWAKPLVAAALKLQG